MNIPTETDISKIRKTLLENIFARQDTSYRWGYDEKQSRERPDFIYYSPNYTSTLWTLTLLADIKAPVHIPQIHASLQLITGHFYDPEHGVFRLPGMSHFPIPCLNGNMIYLHNYFETAHAYEKLNKAINFFATYQRFDDGSFKTPSSYPYCGNSSCYGKHSCFWGVTKILKGISFIPKSQRSREAQLLIKNCIDFVLEHGVCYASRHADKFLSRDINKLTFPNFYKSDFLEILWLLAREEVRDVRISRSVDLLRSKMKDGGIWELEKPVNTIAAVGRSNYANTFITARAVEVLDFYGG